MKICLVVSVLIDGDAIGNNVLAQKEIITKLGVDCFIYADTILDNSSREVMHISTLRCNKDDLIIHHISGFTRSEALILRQPCKKVFLFHNITPPEFVSGQARISCKYGLKQISKSIYCYDYIVADSKYNLSSLKDLGIDVSGDVLPLPIGFNYLVRKEKSSFNTNFLFVGRYAENKKLEDVIDCFNYYHNNYDNQSTLKLVGNDSFSPIYTKKLRGKVEESTCRDSIRLMGKVSDKELKDIYQGSDFFICMSEHEGFCVPLLEAMYNDVVVIAYNSSAIAETLGSAGVLINEKHPQEIAEIINLIIKDNKRKQAIIAEQKKRVNDFSNDIYKSRFILLLNKWLKENPEKKKTIGCLFGIKILKLKFYYLSFFNRLKSLLKRLIQ